MKIIKTGYKIKIKRNVNGEEMEFELTEKELKAAHSEYERMLNLADVVESLNDCDQEIILDILGLQADDFSEEGMNDLVRDIKANEDLILQISLRSQFEAFFS